jgi:hypothetical protein
MRNLEIAERGRADGAINVKNPNPGESSGGDTDIVIRLRDPPTADRGRVSGGILEAAPARRRLAHRQERKNHEATCGEIEGGLQQSAHGVTLVEQHWRSPG